MSLDLERIRNMERINFINNLINTVVEISQEKIDKV